VKVSSEIKNLEIFIAGDYSGIEVRMLCQASGDKLLTSQFNSGLDVHSLVGNKLTGWPVEKILADKATRTKVKEFHFGIIYGLGPENGPKNLEAKGVKMTKAEFVKYQQNYFLNYGGVKIYIDKCHMDAERGFVETIFGFRRRIRKDDPTRGSYYKNQAVNSPIQGGAHQLVLIAMALLRLKPKTYDLLQTPVMEVHDELVFRTRFGTLPEADLQLRHLLQEGVPAYCKREFGIVWRIPLVAETEGGFCRGSMVTYKDDPIPSIERFLIDWRKKHAEVASKPLEYLLSEIEI